MIGTCVEAACSSGLSGGMHGDHSRRSFVILAMVSVVAEKAGDDPVQPIGSRVGMENSFGSLGLFGKGTVSLGAPLGVRWS